MRIYLFFLYNLYNKQKSNNNLDRIEFSISNIIKKHGFIDYDSMTNECLFLENFYDGLE